MHINFVIKSRIELKSRKNQLQVSPSGATLLFPSSRLAVGQILPMWNVINSLQQVVSFIGFREDYKVASWEMVWGFGLCGKSTNQTKGLRH
jgi:hypothetical protein